MMDWWKYTDAYKEAADSLLAKVKGDGRTSYLLYPILFLYRHYVEILMKEAIKFYDQSNVVSEKTCNTHDLDKLWASLWDLFARKKDEDLATRLSAKQQLEFDSHIESLGRAIHRFTEWDPTGQSFRYPIDRKGQRVTPDIKNISLDGLSETVEAICGKLGAIVEYVIDRSDEKDRYDRSLMGSGALGTHCTYYAEDEEIVKYLNIEPSDQELEEAEESGDSEESL